MIDVPSVKSLLKSGYIYCATVDALLQSQYGEQCYAWDPTTLWLEMKDDFGVEVDTDIMDKVGAAQVIMTSDAFFKRVDGFSNIANTLGGGDPGFQMMDPVTTEEAVWAIVEVAIMRDFLTLSPSVQEFVQALFQGTNPHPIVSYVVASEEVNSEEIIRMALDAAKSPGDPVDEYIAEQLQDLRQQLNETNLTSYIATKVW